MKPPNSRAVHTMSIAVRMRFASEVRVFVNIRSKQFTENTSLSSLCVLGVSVVQS
jgi:hypothetical protein